MTDNDIREGARPRAGRDNTALRAQVDVMLEGLQAQTEAFAAAQGAVADTTAQAQSPDGLVRVTVDAAGAVRSVVVAPTAFTRTTPERLAESFTAAAHAATAEARARVAELVEPVTAFAASLPDLADLVPGAPSMRGLFPTVATEFTAPTSMSAEADADADERYDWRAPIMTEAHRG